MPDCHAMKPALALCVALLCGCATHPLTGRQQVIALPLVQAAHADATYALLAGAQGIADALPCLQDCASALERARFARRVDAVAARLGPAAHAVAPDVYERIGVFQVQVVDALGVGTGSSAGGYVAIGSGLATLEPSDTVIAFLVAREMAHVIARHAEEDSGASLVVSALGMLLPGVSVVVRAIATTLGAGALKASWATHQQREADEIALAMLQHAGLSAPGVAVDLSSVRRANVPDDNWGERYLESAQRVTLIAASQPPP